mmetsp:Transcript_26102/g.75336  ORF Transcript_26102/g.75336 Transcript_26102/m.75336 type:complete len:196 (+) Transcript_26102:298-885(+)
MQIVGLEGMWGLLLTLFLVLPALYLLPGEEQGHLYDGVNDLVLLSNSAEFAWLSLAGIAAHALHNATSMGVLSVLSGVQREMVGCTRTCFIWLFGLAARYLFGSRADFAEAWTGYSFLQLAGFLLLVLGQLIYGGFLGAASPPSGGEAMPSAPRGGHGTEALGLTKPLLAGDEFSATDATESTRSCSPAARSVCG